jgi:glycosyltransferase involved in cell wall biosynthesis
MISTGFHPQVGGVERQLLGLATALAREGYPVDVLTRYLGTGPVDEELSGVKVHRVRLLHSSRTLASASFLFGGLRWIRGQVPSSTSSHRSRPIDIFHCHQAFSATNLGVLAKRMLGGGRVVSKITISGVLSEMAAATRELAFASIRRKLLNEVDAFIAISDEIFREIHGAGIPEHRIVRIPNGVAIPERSSLSSESRARARAALSYPWNRIAVFVGRLAWEKGLFVLLDAWKEVSAKLPDAGLVLVGDGGSFRNVEDELRERVSTLGLASSVLFAGRQADVGPMLRSANLLVQPSFSEGMSNAVLEAMASGRAVVATDLPSNRELIRPDESGYLVPAGGARELATALSTALESTEKTDRMGQKARETIERSYSFDRVVERYRVLYEDLTARGRTVAVQS